jgi:hypothetical protein
MENQIIRLFSSIAVNYPELYATLDENPVAIPSKVHADIEIRNMEDY